MKNCIYSNNLIEEVPARIRPALEVLLEAMCYAEQTSGDCWEFAVEQDHLTSMGLTRNDFRWLVRKGLVEHQREVTLEGNDGREFRPTGDLTFSQSSCFVLTETGVLVASESNQPIKASVLLSSNLPDSEDFSSTEPSIPIWDSQQRELRFNSVTVKKFKWAAANQEVILAAFEEEGWPSRIDDPLSPQPGQNPKRRLSDTIKCLNRNQITPLIHFHGDGTGEGVVWKLAQQSFLNKKVCY